MRETDLSLASKGITRKNIYICFYTAGPVKLWNRKTTVRPNFYDAQINCAAYTDPSHGRS